MLNPNYVCEVTHILSFYRRVKSEAAVNWVLVKVNRCSGLKAVKKKENRWTAD
jgi:hypothetical protein